MSVFYIELEFHNCAEAVIIQITKKDVENLFNSTGFLKHKNCSSCGERHIAKATGEFFLHSELKLINGGL